MDQHRGRASGQAPQVTEDWADDRLAVRSFFGFLGQAGCLAELKAVLTAAAHSGGNLTPLFLCQPVSGYLS